MIKKLFIICLIDLILLGIFVFRIHPSASVSIMIIVYVPFLFIINMVIGIVLKIFKNKWGIPFLLNSILSSIIFFFLFNYAITYSEDSMSKSFYFKNGNKKYFIDLTLNDGKYENNSDFNLYELEDGSSSGIMMGYYVTYRDTLFLKSNGKQMLIYKNTLFDHPQKGNKIQLDNRMK